MLPDDAPADWNRPFLNIVAECEAQGSPEELLDRLKQIELELGRGEHARWAPRTIDLDILLWGSERIATERLTVPHPGIIERAFVLTPLAALAPLATIPGRGTKTVLEWSREPGASHPALDGHLERDAGFVLRRRPLRDSGPRSMRTSMRSSRPARRSSTWARSRPGPERRRSTPSKSGSGSSACSSP